MSRRKELRLIDFEMREGFDGTGAVNDASIAASDTVLGVDTLVLADDRKIVPVGALFTTAGITTTRTVTASQNSQQFVLDMTAPTAGTFDITVNGDTAASQAYDIAAATLQSNLEALSGVGAGNVTVTESTDVYTITFAGTLANISTNTLTVDGSSLTAANSHVLTNPQDGTTTWELTFTPAIAAGSVPADDDVITFYPRRITAKTGEGNIEHNKTKDPQVYLNRGKLDGVTIGNEQAMTVDFTYVYDWLRSSTADVPTVDEVLEQEGEAADWLTSATDKCEPYQVDLFLIDRPDCGSQKAEVVVYRFFIATSVNASVEAASVTVSGISITTKPEVYRVTNDDDTIAQLR